MSGDTRTQILALGNRWAEAEQNGDTTTLDELAAADFRLVGPLGFILGRDQWLQRYSSGALDTRSLDWDQVEVRDFGDTAIAIGRHTQQASYAGRPADGQFRITHVFVRGSDAAWRIANIQLSQLAAAGPS
ncbi:MAG: nuclear transport factor 2 family protein [Streptosporangiaceae bacterium]